jgi:hypothetical protein
MRASSLLPLLPPVQRPLPWINDFRRHDVYNGNAKTGRGIDGRRFCYGPRGTAIKDRVNAELQTGWHPVRGIDAVRRLH